MGAALSNHIQTGDVDLIGAFESPGAIEVRFTTAVAGLAARAFQPEPARR